MFADGVDRERQGSSRKVTAARPVTGGRASDRRGGLSLGPPPHGSETFVHRHSPRGVLILVRSVSIMESRLTTLPRRCGKPARSGAGRRAGGIEVISFPSVAGRSLRSLGSALTRAARSRRPVRYCLEPRGCRPRSPSAIGSACRRLPRFLSCGSASLARVAEFGRRNGLKIRFPTGSPGSSPGAGTN